ncbi:MAG: hypothetical protein L0I93_03515 [Atopostipes suicloacalis]|nr:hypothetical protein [Atopostipes suicloacalis]
MSEWILFLIGIGSLIVALSPTFSYSGVGQLIGIIIIAIGAFLYMKQKKDKKNN